MTMRVPPSRAPVSGVTARTAGAEYEKCSDAGAAARYLLFRV
jgi:hypothetical protein